MQLIQHRYLNIELLTRTRARAHTHTHSYLDAELLGDDDSPRLHVVRDIAVFMHGPGIYAVDAVVVVVTEHIILLSAS